MRNVDAAGLNIRKDDMLYINIGALASDPTQWQQPQKFIPERFDPKSRFFLTPEGKKRNPFAFCPFLGGSRICLGKTFVEEASKITLPNLLKKFRFEITNQDNFELPFNTL